jgi:ABC-type cobalamin transport system permease subunit
MSHGPITYILPDLTWEILLDAILRDAPVGAVIEVHTAPMQALVERRLAEAGRTDMVLRLVEQAASGSRW